MTQNQNNDNKNMLELVLKGMNKFRKEKPKEFRITVIFFAALFLLLIFKPSREQVQNSKAIMYSNIDTTTVELNVKLKKYQLDEIKRKATICDKSIDEYIGSELGDKNLGDLLNQIKSKKDSVNNENISDTITNK